MFEKIAKVYNYKKVIDMNHDDAKIIGEKMDSNQSLSP
jgi:hypothetical protein